jgi:hypothetical protein
MTQRCFVSAMPDFWRLDVDSEFKGLREPIIAWELRPGVDLPNVNFFGHPVTMVWRPLRDAVVAILCPDGLVRLSNGTTFPSAAEWLVHEVDQARAREEI